MNKAGKNIENTLLFFAYLLIAVFVLVPILWMFKVALSPRLGFSIIPERLTLEHFISIGRRREIWAYFFNSLKICGGTIAVTLPLALIAAFSLARFSFRGKEPLAVSFLILPMLPAAAILVPLVSYFNRMHLYNTITSVIIVNIIFDLPLSIWMLRNFIVNTPRAIEEAAYLDGLSHLSTLFRVTVPIIRPGIIAVTVYIFIGCWNGYTFSYALTTAPEKRVLAQAVLAFLSAWGTDWGGLNAMGVIMLIPPVLVFLIFQKSFVAGMFGQALK